MNTPMNRSIFRFTLDMHSHRSQASISSFKGDTAVRLYITLTDGGNIYKITDGCSAILSGTKADGSKLWNRCLIEGDTIVYDFNEQTAACIGIATCEITLYKGKELITAPKFIIVVDEREITPDDVIQSVSYIDLLNAEEERLKAEEARNLAENGKIDSKGEVITPGRVHSEEARVDAENARATAEKARVEAETQRDIAENGLIDTVTGEYIIQGRAFAETKRVTAENARVIAENTRVAAEKAREATITAIHEQIGIIDAQLTDLIEGESESE